MPPAQSFVHLPNPGDSDSGCFVTTHTHTEVTASVKDETFQLHQE